MTSMLLNEKRDLSFGVDVRQLRCFVAVAEELHFGRAAARLHVAQPAVSQTVRGLEDEIGVRLFDRTNRRVVLTDGGRVLLGRARSVIDQFDAMVEAMARVRAGESARVVIGSVVGLPPELLPTLLTGLRRQLPDVTVVARAFATGGSSVAAAIERDGVDVAFVRDQVVEPGLEAHVVYREPVGVALPAGDPLAASDAAVRAGDLVGRAFVSFPRDHDPDRHDRIFGALLAAGLDRMPVVHESAPGAVDASLRLVATGAAVSLKLASEVRAFRGPDVVWRPLADLDLEVVVSALWRADHPSPAVRRVAGWLAQAEPVREAYES
jgi:DNA-binding transcriptional LysR family regulator